MYAQQLLVRREEGNKNSESELREGAGKVVVEFQNQTARG